MAEQPWHPMACMALRSAWIPAPPPESDPAMVYTMGGGIDNDDDDEVDIVAVDVDVDVDVDNALDE